MRHLHFPRLRRQAFAALFGVVSMSGLRAQDQEPAALPVAAEPAAKEDAAGDASPDKALFDVPIPSGDPAELFSMPVPEVDPFPFEPVPEIPAARKELIEFAMKVGPAVMSLRVWDEYGVEIARGCGCFVSASGVILTDLELAHPDPGGKIDSISAVTGDGHAFRVRGAWMRDPATGLSLLQAETNGEVPFVPVGVAARESKEARKVTVVGFVEGRGLSLADAQAVLDDSLAGEGWMNLSGRDSMPAVGSPVLSQDGEVIGFVSMRLPGPEWTGFAQPVEGLPAEKAKAKRQSGVPVALDQLPRSIEGGRVADDTVFIDIFKRMMDGENRSLVPALIRLSRKYPRSAEVWALLAVACHKAGARREAHACAAKAAALDPGAGLYWYQLAAMEMGNEKRIPAERLETARVSLERAVEEQATNGLSWFLLGKCRLAQGDMDGSVEALERAVALSNHFSSASYLLGYAYAKTGRYSMADAALKQAVSAKPADKRSWYLRAMVLRKDGKLQEAADAMQRVTRIDSKDQKAWLALAHLYKELRNPSQAGVAYDRFRRLAAAGAKAP